MSVKLDYVVIADTTHGPLAASTSRRYAAAARLVRFIQYNAGQINRPGNPGQKHQETNDGSRLFHDAVAPPWLEPD